MSNQAAWLTEAKTRPFKIDYAPMPKPQPHEVVIKNHAVAVNPVDAAQQSMGIIIESYPATIGCDVAGDIVEVGSDVKDFKVGDRVLAMMLAYDIDRQDTSRGAFQLYSCTSAVCVSHIPDYITYAQASVLPAALATAATGMYQKDLMALPHPQVNSKPNGKTFLVWGGSSSVGSCAIQLAIASGYEVATTASPHNYQYVKDLGAKYVFDHASSSVVEDLVTALKGKEFGGAYNAIITQESTESTAAVLGRLGGNKVLGSVIPPGMPLGYELPSDIKLCNIFCTTLARNEVGRAIYRDWVPGALANGTLKCKPDPMIVGNGLEAIQAGCDAVAKGVSAQKVVVELS